MRFPTDRLKMQARKQLAKIWLLVVLLFKCGAVSSQAIMPGGVKGAHVWEITQHIQGDQAQWKSGLRRDDDSVFYAGSGITINNNPALNIPSVAGVYSLNLGSLNSFSLFTVCQEADTLSEKVIFSLENDTASELVLTNYRMALPGDFQYVNYGFGKRNVPVIYSYTQKGTADSVAKIRNLHFATHSNRHKLPVTFFKGAVPELILFNRSLSVKERNKIESYLAIKYGITLNQEYPVSYLNSRGEMIWNGEGNILHNRNIAAIGRDNQSGLYQKVSESCHSPGLIKIGFLSGVRDNTFISWGDNGGEPSFVDHDIIRSFRREWKICSFNASHDSVFAEIDPRSFKSIKPLREGEKFWVKVDRTGTGKYPAEKTEYIPCFRQPEGMIGWYWKTMIDDDQSGSDIFTLLAAPGFFCQSNIMAPTCFSNVTGSINTSIAGGKPPYSLLLSGSDLHQQVITQTNYHSFNGLKQGGYTLTITDSDKKSFVENLWISNSSQWASSINSFYDLSEGETLSLDASLGNENPDFRYVWSFPDGKLVEHECVQIQQQGNYLLSVTDGNNCTTTHAFQVSQADSKILKDYELFPNPTNGWFAIRLELEKVSDVNIAVLDVSGKVVKQNLLQNDYYYWFSDNIKVPGSYFMVITAGNEKKALKLLVQ